LLLGFALVGAVVSVGLGVYGRVHDATFKQIPHPGFSGTINLKAWLATAVLTLAVLQLTTALAIYGRLPLRGAWLAPLHRASGTLAFVTSLPVAYACLWSLGFQTVQTRQLVHSLLGCAFYGVFTTKMLALRSSQVPAWALPLLGGLLLTVVVGLWLTSALWFFKNVGFPQF
jgi:hypothetical protein